MLVSSSKRASLSEQRAQILDPFAIYAEVAMSQPRGRPNGDEVL
jgi:hypothetical protein